MRAQQPYERHIAAALAEQAERGVPATAGVRAAFEERLAARDRQAIRAARGRFAGLRRAFIVAGGLVLALVLLAAVPPVRAALNAGRELRFGLVLLDPQAPPPTAAPAPTVALSAASGGPLAVPKPCTPGAVVVPCRRDKVSIAEAQRQAAFPLRLPTWLPDGLQAADAFVSPSGGVSIFLRRSGSMSAVQFEQVQAPAGGGYGVAASRVEQVRVAGRPAAYAKGGWRGPGVWDETIDLQYLSWEADGMSYVLHDNGVDLSREELIRIAESVR